MEGISWLSSIWTVDSAPKLSPLEPLLLLEFIMIHGDEFSYGSPLAGLQWSAGDV